MAPLSHELKVRDTSMLRRGVLGISCAGEKRWRLKDCRVASKMGIQPLANQERVRISADAFGIDRPAIKSETVRVVGTVMPVIISSQPLQRGPTEIWWHAEAANLLLRRCQHSLATTAPCHDRHVAAGLRRAELKNSRDERCKLCARDLDGV